MFCLIWRIKWYGWKNQKFYIDQSTEEYINVIKSKNIVYFKKYILAVTLYFIKFTSLVIIKIFKAIPFEKKWNIFYS